MTKSTLINRDIELIRLVTAGSVDDGKSTLIGRLLCDSGVLFEDQLSLISDVAKRRGEDKLDLSLLLDGLSAEREQGITIDVAYRYFLTEKRKFIVADTPGHEQYTRNMATGASNADLALVLADVTKGLLVQSKRHLFIASLLGISHIVVAINKMDLVGYDRAKFEQVRKDFVDFAAKLNFKDLQFIPLSALNGDMIVERGKNMNWYNGSTLLAYLENTQIASDRNLIDFRMPVQNVIKLDGVRGYAGRIESGVIKEGEKVVVLPSGVASSIDSVICDGACQQYAFSPQSVMLTLTGDIDVSRGDVIVREDNLPRVGREIEAMICWLDNEAMRLNKRYLIKHTAKTTFCFVEDLKYRLDVETLHREHSGEMSLNEIGRVSIRTNEPLIFDSYSRNKNMGNFIVIDEFSNNTVGAGVILDKGKKTDLVYAGKNLVADNGFVLWFTGLSGSGKTTIADGVYKYLFGKGIDCEILDGDVMRKTLSVDLGFSREDRVANIERAGFVADLLSRHGVVVLATFVSPYTDCRQALRDKLGDRFIEIFVNTPIEICEERDVKGLYKKARRGEIKDFTGITDTYEAPVTPEIEIQTDGVTSDEVVGKIIDYLLDNKYISGE